jgi:hypothetical protein
MQSNPKDLGANENSNDMKDEREKVNDSITPILISWLRHATATQGEDMVKLDGVILDKMKLCGRLVSVTSKNTKTYLKVEDGTDFIELSCNKKFDEELPKVLREINIEKSRKKEESVHQGHHRGLLVRREDDLHRHQVQPDQQPQLPHLSLPGLPLLAEDPPRGLQEPAGTLKRRLPRARQSSATSTTSRRAATTSSIPTTSTTTAWCSRRSRSYAPSTASLSP